MPSPDVRRVFLSTALGGAVLGGFPADASAQVAPAYTPQGGFATLDGNNLVVPRVYADNALLTSAGCQFILGFKTLHDAIPDIVGNCLNNQFLGNPNGDQWQNTTNGLLVWREDDNWTAFTTGYQTWINGPQGIQERLNTQRFPWEADAWIGAINDINIKYSDVGRQNFIRQLFIDGRGVFDQVHSASDSNPQFDGYFQNLTGGDTPAGVWAKAGTLDQAIVGVDYVGPPDSSPIVLHAPCTKVCWQLSHDRPDKNGSIGTTEAFYQGIPKASSAFTYAYQVFSVIKEAKDLAYRRYTTAQGAEALSHFDIAVQLNKYISAYKTTNKTILGLTIDEMISLRDQYMGFAMDPNCC